MLSLINELNILQQYDFHLFSDAAQIFDGHSEAGLSL
jgi:hypothetical protein